MAQNIRNVDVERPAAEATRPAYETVVCQSLREFMEQNVWPSKPPSELGRAMSREEEDRILGYGPEGY